MFEFCGGKMFDCVEWFSHLLLWQQITLGLLVLVTIFIVLRLVYYICSAFD